ncbi:PHP-associated domain-containing protein [Dactylosporangium sp. NPDC051541]|uniref:PHP-associated domain-containing protein n=1 Tax=Dactylosporangium sp. NPDC051541 TaxID=3363977 RepID=UPI0037A14374
MAIWLRGDCHVHSAASTGGELTPEQVVAEAVAAGLDFIAVTEHGHAETYEHFRAVAGDLLVLRGVEHVTPDGHWLEIEGGLRIAAHPFAPYPTGTMRRPWDEFDVIEVWNGPWTSDRPWQADNEAALAEWGRRLDAGIRQPAIGSSDAHLAGQLGVPHTVVRAEERTPAAIVAGLRAGHSWIAAGPGVQLDGSGRRVVRHCDGSMRTLASWPYRAGG